MPILAPLLRNEVAAVGQSKTFTQALSLAVSVPENITVPLAEDGLPATYVVFGASVSSDFYADSFTTQEGADRITNGTYAEYVTNGGFGSDTSWTKGTGWTISAGVATAAGAISTALSQTSAITLIAGYTYTITYTVTRTAGTVTPSIGGTAGTARSTDATFTETIVAGSTQILAFTGAGFTGTIDVVSVTAWVLGAGWTTDGVTAVATGGISTAISQTANYNFSIVANQPYLLTIVVTRSAGSITPSIGGTAGTSRSTSATFSEIIIAGTTQAISFATSGFTGTLDSVTLTACANVPGDVTSGIASRQNPMGFLLTQPAAYVSVIMPVAGVITASFYKG